jgi:ketosteroid isomerase-like protein
MNPNEQLIRQFYTSFKHLDAQGMGACYHADICFSDPAFPDLKGKEAGAMWAMLVDALKKNPQGWKLEFEKVNANENEGSCRWQAYYTFSLTGRKVHNIIDAHFRFKNGKIIEHTDTFDFYRWARMAFGFTGLLLGWTAFFKRKVQATTTKRLALYLSRSD